MSTLDDRTRRTVIWMIGMGISELEGVADDEEIALAKAYKAGLEAVQPIAQVSQAEATAQGAEWAWEWLHKRAGEMGKDPIDFRDLRKEFRKAVAHFREGKT